MSSWRQFSFISTWTGYFSTCVLCNAPYKNRDPALQTPRSAPVTEWGLGLFQFSHPLCHACSTSKWSPFGLGKAPFLVYAQLFFLMSKQNFFWFLFLSLKRVSVYAYILSLCNNRFHSLKTSINVLFRYNLVCFSTLETHWFPWFSI